MLAEAMKSLEASFSQELLVFRKCFPVFGIEVLSGMLHGYIYKCCSSFVALEIRVNE